MVELYVKRIRKGKMTLDEMASEMCGKYCRYPKEYDEEVMEVTMFD